jgi:hypothetical protein
MAGDFEPEPGFYSTKTMNTPHGYDGWKLGQDEFADLIAEAAESLHFLFTHFPEHANQRACLANTLSLLANISNGLRATNTDGGGHS